MQTKPRRTVLGFRLLTVVIGLLLLLIIGLYSIRTDNFEGEQNFASRVDYIKDQCDDYTSLSLAAESKSMLRIAERVANKLELQALITGESLAQVASQTMAALACTDQAQDLPVLRPCIGMDKIEIINISRKIGTFETSIEPYEDCCTIFTPPHPKTNPTLDEILAAEAAMPELAALETEAAENVEKIYIRMGDDELL